jgi:hypothetical protein
VATDLGGFVFCGVSGSGKSTVAKLSRGTYDVLTDEMSLIERVEGGYRVWGTPFWGELQMSVNRSAPVRAVFLLTKAPFNSLSAVRASEGIAEFMRIILYFGQNLEVCERVLSASMEFVRKVTLRRLNFLPEASLWGVIRDEFGE